MNKKSQKLKSIPQYKCHVRYRLPSLLAILALALLPSDGLGVSTCLFHHLFKLPCPACGLTRSMSSILNLEWTKSFFYHPLGGIVLIYLLTCLLTNKPDFLSFKLNCKNVIIKKISLYHIIIFLFLIVWIIRII